LSATGTSILVEGELVATPEGTKQVGHCWVLSSMVECENEAPAWEGVKKVTLDMHVDSSS
jgi:hypothetical protein